MAEQLTIQQQQAVNDRGGDLLVSAAAGSGKTKVLVERLMQYITDPVNPVNIDDFLIITFTKAAAAELRGKIAKALTQRIAEDPGNLRLQQQFQRLYLAKISTVHAFCADILREYAYMLEIPGDFRMIDELEDTPLRYQVLEKVLSEAYDSVGIDADFTAFVDTQGVGRNDQQIPDLILKVYDSAMCHIDSEGWLQKCLQDADISGITDVSETLWGRYLIDELFEAIDQHLQALEKTAIMCDNAEGLDKMSQILRTLANQLRTLRAAKTWDAIYANRTLDGGNLRGIGTRKNVDKETYAMAKIIRDSCLKDMEVLLRNFGNDSRQVLADLQNILPATRGLVNLVHTFAECYGKVKQAMRVMDFSDLEHRALDLLLGKSRSGPTAAARQIGQRFCQIMVDEFQDTNQVQDAIFSALSNGRNNLFMVGDVKQSIYQFRLADPGIFLEKYNRFTHASEAEPGQGRKIVLSNNFRSGTEVIEAVNSVFRYNMSPKVGGLAYGDEEALWEGIPHDPLPEGNVELHVIDVAADTYSEEADYVAERITQLLDGKHLVRGEDGLRPIRPDDIVILLRSPKTSGWDFHYALQKRGLQTVSSHSIDLLSTDEVEWLRSFLQTILNPQHDIPLIATITGPVFGFTANDLAAIRAGKRKISFYDALRQSNDEKVKGFLSVLTQLRDCARLHTLAELLENIFSLTRADAVYAAMPDGKMRSDNLQEFYQYVVRYSSVPGADLQQLLTHLQQCEADGLKVNYQNAASGCIQITSIHKSKGLEYPVVFLCGLSRLFNMRSTNGVLLCDAQLGLGLSCVDDSTRIRYPSVANSAISRKMKADSISEELRVLYVAMTRPKDRLIMTFAQTNIADKLNELSVRMDICPKALLSSRVNCLGMWVLQTALNRTEAGSLFAVSRKPNNTSVSEILWNIQYVSSTAVDTDIPILQDAEKQTVSPQVLENLQNSLSFVYPYKEATVMPSKQTATQIKGRQKDQEASEDAPVQKHFNRVWRKPGFAPEGQQGRELGNITHIIMQHLNFTDCSSVSAIKRQIDKICQDGFITTRQADLVQPEKLYTFFTSEFGRKLCASKQVLREFKFSILEDAPGIEDDKILLQGVVDCAIIEEDGIIVVDFKTDRITQDTLLNVVQRYKTQVEIYAKALSRIFKLPVKKKALYFFSADHLQWL